jgi:hypothetical protein
VGWSPAGFLGDELPSETASNAMLLKKALRDIRPGDILLAHLGIWSRKDPWAPADLEPLIVGLKARGFCFATLREHPPTGTGSRALSKISAMEWFSDLFERAQQGLFELAIQPIMFSFGLGNLLEDGYTPPAGCWWA